MFAARYGKKIMSSERGVAKELAVSVVKMGTVGAVVVAGALYVVDEVTDKLPDFPGLPGLAGTGEWIADRMNDFGIDVGEPESIRVGADGSIDSFEPVTDETPLYTRSVSMNSIEIGDGVVIEGEYRVQTSLVGDLTLGRDGSVGSPDTKYYIFMHDGNGTPDNPADDTLKPFDPNSPGVQFIDTIGTVRVVETAKLYEQCLDDLGSSDEADGDRSLSGCEIREINHSELIPSSVIESARQAYLYDQRCGDTTLHRASNTWGYNLTSPLDVNSAGIMGDKTVTMQHLAAAALADRFAPLLGTTSDKVRLVVKPQVESLVYSGDGRIDFSEAVPVYWETAKDLDLNAIEANSDGLYKAPPVVVSWCSGSIRDLPTYIQNIGGPISEPGFSEKYLTNGLVYSTPDAVVPILAPQLPQLSDTVMQDQDSQTNVTTTTVG